MICSLIKDEFAIKLHSIKPGNYKVLDLCLPNFFGNSAEVNAPFADVKSAFHNSISKG